MRVFTVSMILPIWILISYFRKDKSRIHIVTLECIIYTLSSFLLNMNFTLQEYRILETTANLKI